MRVVKKIHVILFLFGFLSCSKKLDTETIYEFTINPILLDSKIISEGNGYDLSTKKMDFAFALLEGTETRMLLKSDSIIYSFNGSYEFIKGRGDVKDSYFLSLNGNEETKINFKLELGSNLVYTVKQNAFPEVTSKFKNSKFTLEQVFNQDYKEGFQNTFLPLKLNGSDNIADSLNDYWVDYFELTDEKDRRNRIREQRERQQRLAEQRRLEEQKRNKLKEEILFKLFYEVVNFGFDFDERPSGQSRTGYVPGNSGFNFRKKNVITVTYNAMQYQSTESGRISDLRIDTNCGFSDCSDYYDISLKGNWINQSGGGDGKLVISVSKNKVLSIYIFGEGGNWTHWLDFDLKTTNNSLEVFGIMKEANEKILKL